MSHVHLHTHVTRHTMKETLTIFEHASLTALTTSKLSLFVLRQTSLTLCCFPTGLKKRTRKAFGIRKKEKDTDSTYVL